MNRLTVLRRHPRRTVGALAVSLAAFGVAVGSGATFTSSSADASNTFTAGLLTHVNTPSGTLVAAELTNLKPGFGTTGGNTESAALSTSSPGYGRIVLDNNGNLAGDFRVVTAQTSTAYTGTSPAASTVCGGACSSLDGALRVAITKTDTAGGGVVKLYDGLVKDVAAAKLGTVDTSNTFTLDAGAKRTYDAYFYLPQSTPSAYQGGSARVNLAFEQTQQ